MKAHLPLWRLRRRGGWIEQGHDTLKDTDDCGLVRIKPSRQFLFECGQFAGELASIGESGAHLHEGTHYKDAHLHGLRALENSGGHDGTVFGKSEGQVLHVAAMP